MAQWIRTSDSGAIDPGIIPSLVKSMNAKLAFYNVKNKLGSLLVTLAKVLCSVPPS